MFDPEIQPLANDLDQISLEAFSRFIKKTDRLLEYGSGLSTLVAIKNVKKIYSVETDQTRGKLVRRMASRLAQNKLKMIIPEIGDIGYRGYPISLGSAPYFYRYPFDVWQKAMSDGFQPQLVLIQGRFRVVCFLVSLLNLSPGATLLFKDFKEMNHRYSEINSLISPLAYHGKLAEFDVPVELDLKLLAALLAKHLIDRR
jgi:hypothetical protein